MLIFGLIFLLMSSYGYGALCLDNKVFAIKKTTQKNGITHTVCTLIKNDVFPYIRVARKINSVMATEGPTIELNCTFETFLLNRDNQKKLKVLRHKAAYEDLYHQYLKQEVYRATKK